MFQNKLKFALLAVLCFSLLQAQGLEEPELVETIVVTANRDETPTHEVGSSYSVITAADIERSGVTQVADVLRQVAGLDVVRTGGSGQATSVFMRGASSSHTLVMLDGLELNDAISPVNAYDFAHLSVENIERIEVVRGPQSTLYGSDAMAGVIHIITKKGSGDLGGHLALEGGSHGTQRATVGLSGGEERLDYSLTLASLENDGFSNAADTEEKDAYENRAFSARLGLQASEALSFSLTARYTDTSADIDNGPGAFGDDPNHVTDATEKVVKLAGKWQLSDSWLSEASVAHMENERDTVNGTDVAHPDDSVKSVYAGERTRFNWQNRVNLGEAHTLIAGLENEREKGNFSYDSQSAWGPYGEALAGEDVSTSSLYLQDHIRANERLALTLGARYDDHDRFGSKTTWRAAMSWRVAETAWLKGSYGTAFKAPSLYQLYSVLYGNEELLPEESKGWDLGFELQPTSELSLSLGYFRNDFDTLVDFDFSAGGYINGSALVTRGGEFGLNWHHNAFQVTANYSYTKAIDAMGQQLVRRPRGKWNIEGSYHLSDRGDISLAVRHVGSRMLNDFVNFTGVVSVDAYTTVDASTQIKFAGGFKGLLRLENLFDEDYQEIFGYNTAGASIYLGLRYDY